MSSHSMTLLLPKCLSTSQLSFRLVSSCSLVKINRQICLRRVLVKSEGMLLHQARRINYKVPESTTALNKKNASSAASNSSTVPPSPPPAQIDKAQANNLIQNMTAEERILLLTELKKLAAASSDPNRRPSSQELFQLGYHHSLPFIGFGFLDNFVMIVAGEYIDLTLGAKLGISTMAAAALGNTISDMMGIGSAWYVETLATRLGAECPPLTSVQLDMLVSRIATNLGRCLGVMLGCLLGMFPLIFISTEEDKEEKQQEQKDESEPQQEENKQNS